MNKCIVKVKLMGEAKLPHYSSASASGIDLCAYLPEGPIVISPFERVLIPTGLKIALEDGYEAQIRPRSGLAIKHGITVLNTPGTIDSDYRGEIKIINKRTNEIIEPVIRIISTGFEGYKIDDVFHFTNNGSHRMDALTYPCEDWTWELINK